MDDESIALELQRQFEEEEKLKLEQEEKDSQMAQALAAGHAISSSEDENSESEDEKPQCSKSSFDKNSEKNPLKRKSEENRKKISVESNQQSKRTVSDSKHEFKKAALKGKDSATKAVRKMEKQQNKGPSAEKKPDCPSGAKCYRTGNPHHLRQYSHPEMDLDSDEDKAPPVKRRKTEERVSKSCREVLKEAEPFHFLLTKVSGIPPQFNEELAVHIKDILSPAMGELVASAQFNYMFDIPWLMEQYPKEARSKPLLIIHGEKRGSRAALHEAASPFPNIKFCQARLEIMYGTHHSKMMFLLYPDGMRVIIHTANLIDRDWHQKTQGVWISPLFPKLEASDSTGREGDSPTHFRRDLLEYVAAYKSTALQTWRERILQHDMSSALVVLMASVPGRHMGDSKQKWGHMKVKKILQSNGPDKAMVKKWSVVGQFSSVGSLGVDQTKYLCAEWLQSMITCSGGFSSSFSANNVTIDTLKLIFPTVDNVRVSLEGYPAGASIPYSIKNARKQQYFHAFMHQWKASHRGRSRAAPHIKTYARLSPDQKHMAWFMVTSANMSKAAWGALEKNGAQLMIRSYEIGVLFLPKFFVSDGEKFSTDKETGSSSSPYFPVPWDLPLTPHGKTDRPWVWDIPHMEKPDCHGMAWVPPS